MLSTLSKRSAKALDAKSTRLNSKSAGIDKKSVISLCKQSRLTDRDLGEDEEPWYSLESDVVQEELVTSASDGLQTPEAQRRLKEFGPNKLSEGARRTFLQRLWEQVNSIIIYILLAAAVVEGALQSWAEFGLILLVIVLNTAIGMIQEGKAEKAAEAIKAMLSPTARVLRDGEQSIIPADELVPGDIVYIKSGDKIPADMRLLTCTNLQVQEAMLTGESVPVSKRLDAVRTGAPLGDRRCMCYSATAVVSGQGTGVVVATGDSAEIGRISSMVNTVDNMRNNLVHQLEILGRWLAVMVLVIALLAFLLALLVRGEYFGDAFESAVSIAVAIIPEGLPAMVTIVLALGTTVMARNNAIIRQLPAVETLGSLNIICSDKTGTLTKNEMTVVMLRTAASLYSVSGVGYAPSGTFSLATSGPTDNSKPAPMHQQQLHQQGEGKPHVAITMQADGPPGKPPSRLIRTSMTPGPRTPKGSLDGVEAPAAATATTPAEPEAPEGPPLTDAQMAAVRALLRGTVLCNDSELSRSSDEATGKTVYSPLGAPTEVALLTAAEKAGLDIRQLKDSTPRVKSVPFESEHKFMATVHIEGGVRVMYVKGAPERLLPMCTHQVAGDDLAAPPAPLDLAFWHEQQAALSKQGLRVLALCRCELGAGEDLEQLSAAWLQQRPPALVLVLMAAILDPPRPEAIQAVEVAHSAGITVKMITGDHALTAVAIGQRLGLGGDSRTQVFTGPDIDKMNDEALSHIVMGCNVFARASPENKLRIVRALQGHKQVVAMTGDGVNDAPALKAADVGVAMGITGTDVSKEAAKMVLADDNFASIVAAVREGRRVWDNIRKLLIFNLPVNLAQGTSVLYAYILGLDQVPLTALQVLLVNLVTSVTLGLALAAEPAEPGVMQRPPRRQGKRLVGKKLLWRMAFVCHIIVVLVIGMFYWGEAHGLELGQRRAEAFNVLVGAQVAYFVTCRFLKLPTVHPRVFYGNKLIYVAITIVVGLMVFITHTPGVNHFFNMEPMTGLQWLRVVVCVAVVYTIVELEKALIDPVLMPFVRPLLAWCEARTPKWLSVNWPAVPNPLAACTRGSGKGRGSSGNQEEGGHERRSSQRRGRQGKGKRGNDGAGSNKQQDEGSAPTPASTSIPSSQVYTLRAHTDADVETGTSGM